MVMRYNLEVADINAARSHRKR